MTVRANYVAHGKKRGNINMGNLVHNEQVKLFAAFLNNLGVASFATGAVLPVVSLSYASKSALLLWLPFAFGAGLGTYFMMAGHNYLKRLKE